MVGYKRLMKTVHVRRSMVNCSGSKGGEPPFAARYVTFSKTGKAVVQGRHAADNAPGRAKRRSGGILVERYTNLRMRNTTAAPCRRIRSHTSLCED